MTLRLAMIIVEPLVYIQARYRTAFIDSTVQVEVLQNEVSLRVNHPPFQSD